MCGWNEPDRGVSLPLSIQVDAKLIEEPRKGAAQLAQGDKHRSSRGRGNRPRGENPDAAGGRWTGSHTRLVCAWNAGPSSVRVNPPEVSQVDR